MTEPTIICPNCKTEIRLTESLAAPLIAATRQQFEQQLAQKDEDIAKREQGIRDKEKQIAEAKRTLDDQVADQVAAQLKTSAPSRQEKRSRPPRPNLKARNLAQVPDESWPRPRRRRPNSSRSSANSTTPSANSNSPSKSACRSSEIRSQAKRGRGRTETQVMEKGRPLPPCRNRSKPQARAEQGSQQLDLEPAQFFRHHRAHPKPSAMLHRHSRGHLWHDAVAFKQHQDYLERRARSADGLEKRRAGAERMAKND
ncbi:MAG: hypothetical protein IPN75_05240 [Dechloromonas sp.]|uniref:DUF2130 domain-containing protein n=1 Tax=Candidatus Dechloromonas phosphorivorans TaxID=2899244 RepID=A0A9D7LRJ0_9RHOO|nr:hypothetical protein [Candidatus Dechloromonas phosphorivorans]